MNPNRQFAKSINEFIQERQSLERGETVVNRTLHERVVFNNAFAQMPEHLRTRGYDMAMTMFHEELSQMQRNDSEFGYDSKASREIFSAMEKMFEDYLNNVNRYINKHPILKNV